MRRGACRNIDPDWEEKHTIGRFRRHLAGARSCFVPRSGVRAAPLGHGHPRRRRNTARRSRSRQAEKAVAAAEAEAKKNGWNAGHRRRDPTGLSGPLQQDGSTPIGFGPDRPRQGARRTFRRPTGLPGRLDRQSRLTWGCWTLDGVIASLEGGIPPMSGGKIIGAIGCSGATGRAGRSQACKAGADTIK